MTLTVTPTTPEGPREASEWLGTTAAAKRLGIAPATLYRLIDAGDLRAYRIGRVVRLRAHDIDDWLERQRIKPGSLGHLHSEVAPNGSNGHE